MVTHTLKEIASDVAALLGEPLALECQPEESPFPGIEDRVRILAPGILQTLILSAPPGLPEGNKSISATAVIETDGRVVLPLPGDFLRLVAVKMSDWCRPVTDVADGDIARLQTCRWRGIRGVAERPVAIIVFNKAGQRSLELHSSNQGAVLEYCRYASIPVWSSGSAMEVSERFYPDLIRHLVEDIVRQ